MRHATSELSGIQNPNVQTFLPCHFGMGRVPSTLSKSLLLSSIPINIYNNENIKKTQAGRKQSQDYIIEDLFCRTFHQEFRISINQWIQYHERQNEMDGYKQCLCYKYVSLYGLPMLIYQRCFRAQVVRSLSTSVCTTMSFSKCVFKLPSSPT